MLGAKGTVNVHLRAEVAPGISAEGKVSEAYKYEEVGVPQRGEITNFCWLAQ